MTVEAHLHVPAIPETARGPAVPASGYLVDEVAGGVHWITDGGYQNGFVVCEESVVAIDAPPSIGGESVIRFQKGNDGRDQVIGKLADRDQGGERQ